MNPRRESAARGPNQRYDRPQSLPGQFSERRDEDTAAEARARVRCKRTEEKRPRGLSSLPVSQGRPHPNEEQSRARLGDDERMRELLALPVVSLSVRLPSQLSTYLYRAATGTGPKCLRILQPLLTIRTTNAGTFEPHTESEFHLLVSAQVNEAILLVPTSVSKLSKQTIFVAR